MSLIQQHTKHLIKADIQRLYKKVNHPVDWQINVKSYQLIDKIIELWFEEQGYDFWNNLFPEIVAWELRLPYIR
jgi:hypothetical protein